MQPASGGTSGGGGGAGSSGEASRSGLVRFRSAPATWLEALLEEEDDDSDPLKQNQSLTQLLSGNPAAPTARNSVGFADPGLFDVGTSSSGFARQNSSPAEFLAADGYFSNFGIGANFDYMSPNVEVPPSIPVGTRSREGETTQQSQLKYPQLKVEQSGHLAGGVSGMLDAGMDKLLEDSVPFRVRAKRGCATHPRSIAERVRRTRISDRIRKLQELVPNMDKQTNTADMLEEAVEYVKYLQRQIQELTEQQKNCKCTVRD